MSKELPSLSNKNIFRQWSGSVDVKENVIFTKTNARKSHPKVVFRHQDSFENVSEEGRLQHFITP